MEGIDTGIKAKDMLWSHSRVKTFEDCPYRWYLKYLYTPGYHWQSTFFASYGSFVHELIDGYYRGKISSSDLPTRYLTGFREKVRGQVPSEKVFSDWFAGGLRYFRNFQPFPWKPIGTEIMVRFSVSGIKLNGIIDYLGETESGGLVIVDHKSRALKPRTTRKKSLRSDVELDEYLRQLYLYAEAVYQKYGKYPELLCFNCFRTLTLIQEPFRKEKLLDAECWLVDHVGSIITSTEFPPDVDWFKCNFLCECRDECEYYELSSKLSQR